MKHCSFWTCSNINKEIRLSTFHQYTLQVSFPNLICSINNIDSLCIRPHVLISFSDIVPIFRWFSSFPVNINAYNKIAYFPYNITTVHINQKLVDHNQYLYFPYVNIYEYVFCSNEKFSNFVYAKKYNTDLVIFWIRNNKWTNYKEEWS